MIIHGDSLNELKQLGNDSIDTVITDPPYGYSFMGKDWDKAVPSVEIWQECLRVLKPGAFCCVMSAPRSDVQNAMISRLMEAGFRLDFTPIYWTYASGFPKAGNIGKLVDKRLGNDREVVGQTPAGKGIASGGSYVGQEYAPAHDITKGTSPLEGSYAGFQPKPAVEVIIVAMKPLSEKTYVDQALANGKGVSWLDDGRIPTETPLTYGGMSAASVDGVYRDDAWVPKEIEKKTVTGRFPANLVVSNEVLGDYSKYFDVDKWSKGVQDETVPAMSSLPNEYGTIKTSPSSRPRLEVHSREPEYASTTLPFLITPKASKSEKNKGLEHFTPTKTNDGRTKEIDNAFRRGSTLRNNHHPTVKPLKLMSYLITLFSREGDTVLDPFVGSGTTVVAAKQLNRNGIGIEREAEYAEIARARLAHIMPQLAPEQPEASQPPVVIAELVKDSEQLKLV